MLITPIAVPFRSSGVARKVRIPLAVAAPYTVRKLVYLGQYVCNVDRPALEQGFVAGRAPRHGSPFRMVRWNRSVVRRQDGLIALDKANSCIVGPHTVVRYSAQSHQAPV